MQILIAARLRAVLKLAHGDAQPSALHAPDSELVFAVTDDQRMRVLLQDLRPEGTRYTPHGFRRTFSDWAGDKNYSKELRDVALAHAVGDKTFQSYNRGDRLELRREMMQVWSDFAAGAKE